ncbi:MAG: GspH/FimT family pseudopilin [Burkholderiales bacterium]|nr:GspH/FimT family pseudopilin [Burkholderiales bacterium]
MKTQHQHGFSIIEIAVTLAMLGVLMATAMPSFGIWMANARIRSTAEGIHSGLQKARSEAVRRNTSVQFSFVTLTDPNVMDNSCALSATGGSWVVSVSSPAGKCGSAPSTTVSPMVVVANPLGSAGSDVSVAATQRDGTTAATTVTFNALGQVSNSTAIGNISIQHSTNSANYRQLNLVVSTGGQVIVCDPTVTDTSDTRHCPAS